MSQQLRQVIYVSDHQSGINQTDIQNLVEKSRNFNNERGISGMLVSSDDHFYQLIEGPDSDINVLYDRIRLDQRHCNIRTIVSKSIDEKTLPVWDMSYVETGSVSYGADVCYVLKKYAVKDEFSSQDQLGIFLILQGISEHY